jgi:localization factor PodJL
VRISTTSATSSTLENAVKSLADKIDRLQTAPEQFASGPDLGAMIGSLGDKIDRLHTAPAPEHVPAGPDLGAMIGSLGERIDRMQVAPAPVQQVNTDHIVEMISSLSEKIENLRASRGDSDILRQIEDRIGLLSHKLEASEAKLGNLDNIERGMKELLAYLENTRSNAPTVHVAAAAPPVENLAHDVIRTQESLEAAHGTIGDVVDRLAMIETGMRHAPPPAPAAPDAAPVAPQISGVRAAAAPMPGSKSASSPRTASRVDDVLPSDLPLEPGSGYPRQGAGNAAAMPALSAAERIAASKAMAEPSRTAAAEAEPKASFITAARRAAQAAAEDETKLTSRAAVDPLANGAKPKRGLIGRHIKSIIVGASVAIIAAGMVHLAFNFLNSSEVSRSGPDGFKVRDPAMSSRPMPSGTVDVGSSGVLNVAPPATPGANPNAGVLSQPPVTSAPVIPVAPPPPAAIPDRSSATPPPSAAPAPVADVTGALDNQASAVVNAPLALTPVSPQGGRAPSLPAAIGSKILVTAAENGDVTAAYEIATRYSDGRGVPLNPEAAAIWFERASNGGVVPAMFRLGGLYEKGIGVKKDLNKARDLYTAAADRGSAKAMHNLAVLYADGFDGKPDYAAAIQWFRKAGARGVPDSQYNLGVLYARGVGVDQNFGESYRWFALAAQSGDQDAAQKRDDVAKRLDAPSLSAVRAAVQSWAPEPQPDDAVTVKAPPGGWDPSAPAAAPKGKAKRV